MHAFELAWHGPARRRPPKLFATLAVEFCTDACMPILTLLYTATWAGTMDLQAKLAENQKTEA
ncbi:hypothetical protein DWU98_09515 [Dyella monticola]|uniref:Uncharacterized protein n=1 Tax=Dyella monticola TaxID=1927958 RepID=A0A370X1I7_9GAMM|nr:hypothetical protein DWU98_09515 [Dyella monticola]